MSGSFSWCSQKNIPTLHKFFIFYLPETQKNSTVWLFLIRAFFVVPDIPDGGADHKNRIVASHCYHQHTLQQAAISMSYYMFAKQISMSYYMFAEQKLSSSPSSLS